MEEKHIVKLQGKDFVTYEGLIDSAHKKGLKSIKTELVYNDNNLIIFKAIAIGEQGEYHGYGDATDQNVGSRVLPHKIRMAETRAKARALRDYCNIGMCSVEELGDNNEQAEKKQKTQPEIPVPLDADFLKAMAGMKKQVGDKIYYDCLNFFGYKKSNEIVDSQIKKDVYRALNRTLCPECGALWNFQNKRCSANCQTREV